MANDLQSPRSTTSSDQQLTISSANKGKQKSNDADIDSRSYHAMTGHSHMTGAATNQTERLTYQGHSIEENATLDDIIVTTPQRLPIELIVFIIKHLHQNQRTLYAWTLVNKTYHTIANRLLWQHLTFNNMVTFKRLLSGLSESSLSSPPSLYTRNLVLKDSFWTNTRAINLNKLLSHMSHLKQLTVWNDTNPTNLDNMVHTSPYLPGLQVYTTRLTKVFITASSQYCHQLRSFYWKLGKHDYLIWINTLASSPLEHLYIESNHVGYSMPSCPSIQQLTRLTLLHVNQQLPAITKALLDPASTTTPPIIWPELTCLSLTRCNLVSATMWFSLIQSHPRLEYIVLWDANYVTDSILDGMVLWLPNLKFLALSGSKYVSADGVRRLIHGCHSLISVFLLKCPDVLEFYVSEQRTSNYIGNWVILDKVALDHMRNEGANART